jgi:hypothetical protein
VQNGLFRDGRSLVTVTASDGFANVPSALNATYSFATVSFQFESEYVYVIKATSFDDSNTKSVFMRELVMYDASGAKIVYGLDSITASADAPSDGGSLSVLYDDVHTSLLRAAVYRHTAGVDSGLWPLNTNLFTLTLPRAAKEIRIYFSHTSATTAGGFDIAISENGNDLGTSPRNDTNVYPSYWETNWELTGGAAAFVPPAFGGPNLVSAIPDVVVLAGGSKSFNVTSHFNATKTPASAFKYFVTTNNHALVTILSADEDAGTEKSDRPQATPVLRVRVCPCLQKDSDALEDHVPLREQHSIVFGGFPAPVHKIMKRRFARDVLGIHVRFHEHQPLECYIARAFVVGASVISEPSSDVMKDSPPELVLFVHFVPDLLLVHLRFAQVSSTVSCGSHHLCIVL